MFEFSDIKNIEINKEFLEKNIIEKIQEYENALKFSYKNESGEYNDFVVNKTIEVIEDITKVMSEYRHDVITNEVKKEHEIQTSLNILNKLKNISGGAVIVTTLAILGNYTILNALIEVPSIANYLLGTAFGTSLVFSAISNISYHNVNVKNNMITNHRNDLYNVLDFYGEITNDLNHLFNELLWRRDNIEENNLNKELEDTKIMLNTLENTVENKVIRERSIKKLQR